MKWIWTYPAAYVPGATSWELLLGEVLAFLELYRTNLTFLFILQFKITLPNTDYAHEKYHE